MSHEAGKESTEPDEPNVGVIATVTVVGALLVVSTAAALTALVRAESTDHGNQIGAHANLGAVDRLKSEQRSRLEAAPGWSNRAMGQVSVPIERAMDLVAKDLQKNPYLATPLPPRPKEDAGAATTGTGGAPGEAPSALPPATPVAPAAPGVETAAPGDPSPSALPAVAPPGSASAP